MGRATSVEAGGGRIGQTAEESARADRNHTQIGGGRSARGEGGVGGGGEEGLVAAAVTALTNFRR